MSLLERAITALKEAATRPVMEEQELEEVFEHIRCGTPINEKWSDAARAASAAARRKRAQLGPGVPAYKREEAWKRAAADAFMRSKQGQRILSKSMGKASRAVDKVQSTISGLLTPTQSKALQRANNRLEMKVQKLEVGRTYGHPFANKIQHKAGVPILFAPRRRRPRGYPTTEAAHDSELMEVFDHIEFGMPLNEKWSDAARAASAAARKARAKGGDWRKAAVNAFTRSRQGQDIAVKSALRADKAAIAARNAARDDAGMNSGEAHPVLAQARKRAFNRAAKKVERITDTARAGGTSSSRVFDDKNFSKGAKKVMTRVRKGAAKRWNSPGLLSGGDGVKHFKVNPRKNPRRGIHW